MKLLLCIQWMRQKVTWWPCVYVVCKETKTCWKKIFTWFKRKVFTLVDRSVSDNFFSNFRPILGRWFWESNASASDILSKFESRDMISVNGIPVSDWMSTKRNWKCNWLDSINIKYWKKSQKATVNYSASPCASKVRQRVYRSLGTCLIQNLPQISMTYLLAYGS